MLCPKAIFYSVAFSYLRGWKLIMELIIVRSFKTSFIRNSIGFFISYIAIDTKPATLMSTLANSLHVKWHILIATDNPLLARVYWNTYEQHYLNNIAQSNCKNTVLTCCRPNSLPKMHGSANFGIDITVCQLLIWTNFVGWS